MVSDRSGERPKSPGDANGETPEGWAATASIDRKYRKYKPPQTEK